MKETRAFVLPHLLSPQKAVRMKFGNDYIFQAISFVDLVENLKNVFAS